MKFGYNGKKNLVTIFATLLFCCFVFGFENHFYKKAEAKIEEHAHIVSSILWNLNHKGIVDYLNLAVTANNYSKVTIYDEFNRIFHSADTNQQGRSDRLLSALGLMPELSMRSDISYNGQTIGRIEATWAPDTIYTHIYVLFAFTLITIILHLYLTVRSDKRDLEVRVEKRTLELAQTNRTLLREIHQKKKSTSSLRRSEEEYRKLYRTSKSAEELYRSLFDSTAAAVVVLDLDLHIELVNRSFTSMFGWNSNEVKGQQTPLFVPEQKEHIRNLISSIRHSGASCQLFETRCTTRDNEEFAASLSISRFNDHTGTPCGIILFINDISERKKMERQLQQAERMDAVGTLAGGVAHDFNNLLMAIQGNTSMALLESEDNATVHKRLQSIETYIKNGQELTGQLLGFARGGKYEVKPTNLNNLISREARLFGRTRKDLTIAEEYQQELWPVEADQGQIRQVLLNLFVNAGQAMEDNGELRITTSNMDIDNVYTGSYEIPAGRYVRICVSDTGHGMDKKTQAKIFDPFFTTKDLGRGTGLGLASAYGIIKNHNGYIHVYSEVGKGTTFAIYLPATTKEVSPSTDIDPETPVQGQGTILLVDDEEMILEVGRELLRALGYEVVTADSGEKACRLFKENPKSFQVVILDMIMPDMDGGTVFQQLKEIDQDVHVILSSGYSLNGKAAGIMEQGCSAFLQKPFDLKTLSLKLQEAIEADPSIPKGVHQK